MEVSRDDVVYCARLAHISLHADEIESLRQDMTKILNHARNLDQLDLNSIEPHIHSIDTLLSRRSDQALFALTQSEALANAPQTEGNYFLVPKIM